MRKKDRPKVLRTVWEGKAFGKNQRLAKGKYGNLYLSEGYRGFKEGLTLQMVIDRRWWDGPLQGDVEVRIECYVHPKRDVDSLVPVIHDCLESAQVVQNDRQIMATYSRKYRKGKGDPDKIIVEAKVL